MLLFSLAERGTLLKLFFNFYPHLTTFLLNNFIFGKYGVRLTLLVSLCIKCIKYFVTSGAASIAMIKPKK